MAKRTIKINIKLPAGVVATPELTDKATKAAERAVAAAASEIVEAQKLAEELASKGWRISAEELLNRKTKSKRAAQASASHGSSAATGSARKRVVLTDADRQALIADLKSGAKIAPTAKKYGISTATVMNIKTAAGLTKTRGK